MALAKVQGFVTRAEADLVKPDSFSRNITPGNGGAAVHWGGPAPTINGHNDCIRTWRGWQAYHMKTHGWADLAYTGGFCQHGFALAGRGFGTRTAANGTNAGNQNFYAFVWIGGTGMLPTAAAIRALLWWIFEARRRGGAGRRVVPHRVFTGSECPGNDLLRTSVRYDKRRVSDVPATVRPGDRKRAVVILKRRMRVHGYKMPSTSRKYGARLRRQVVDFKRRHGLRATATVGRKAWLALLRKPRKG